MWYNRTMAKREPNPINDEIRALWHPTLNGDKTPDQYTAGSGFKVWWHCERKHDFIASPQSVSAGHGCPYCAGNKAWKGYNDFETLRPEIASQWHSTLNGDANPSDFTVGSKTKVWWTGTCGHDFIAAIGARTVSGTNCPYCAGQKILIGFNDLATTHPGIVEQWHPTKNIEYTPQTVTSGTNKKVWWLGACGHDFKVSVAEKIRVGISSGCPYCAGKMILLGFNDLASQCPEVAKEWSPENEGSPDEISVKSVKVVKWLCPNGHTFAVQVRARVQEGAKCSYCAGKRTLAGLNDVGSTHPHLKNEWHDEKNGETTIDMFSKTSTIKVWWQCNEHKDHVYLSSPQSRTDSRAESGCNICSNRVLQVGFNDFETMFPEATKQWHPTKNGDLLPSGIIQSYSKKVWWLCSKGHEWEVSPKHRVSKNNNKISISNCPTCQSNTFASKAEKEIVAILKILGEEVIANGRKLLKGAELDIYLPNRGIAIEYNGLYWHSIDKNGQYKNYHYDKWLACKKLGVQLIQIWEDDWENKRDIVLKSLIYKIGIEQSKLNSLISRGISLTDKSYDHETIASTLSLEEVRVFCEANHLQGFSSGSHYIGLKNKNGEIVSAMVLKKGKDDTLNIIRYATDRTIVGGFAKLLKYAEVELSVKRFLVFSDHCSIDGSLYEDNGFTVNKEFMPDYQYVVKDQRQNKSGYTVQKFKDSPNFNYVEGMTSAKIAKLNKLPRIYDAGKTRWVKELV